MVTVVKVTVTDSEVVVFAGRLMVAISEVALPNKEEIWLKIEAKPVTVAVMLIETVPVELRKGGDEEVGVTFADVREVPAEADGAVIVEVVVEVDLAEGVLARSTVEVRVKTGPEEVTGAELVTDGKEIPLGVVELSESGLKGSGLTV